MDDIHNKIADHMMHHDAFSKWLGIEVLEIKEGSCKLKMKIREEMTNGFLFREWLRRNKYAFK